MTRVLLLVAVLGCATAFGLWRLRTDGRMRPVAVDDPPDTDDGSQPLDLPTDDGDPGERPGTRTVQALTAGDLGGALGERATLVQFSSAFCQPCRTARLVLGDVAGTVPGVAHVEIDAESHLDLVRRVDVTRTPTVLVLDASGRIRNRATGAPRSADVLAALGSIL